MMLYDLFLNILYSPEKVKVFIQVLNSAFLQLFVSVSLVILIIWIALFCAKAFKTTKLNSRKSLTLKESKSIVKELYEKHKKLIKSVHYLAIGLFLYCFKWNLISLTFSLLSSTSLNTIGTRSSNPELTMLLGNWTLFTLLIFSFAPFFIAFCFGNKFVRNIGILIYILGILFVSFGFFLNLGLYS